MPPHHCLPLFRFRVAEPVACESQGAPPDCGYFSIDSFGLTAGPAWTVKRHSVVAPRIGLVVAPTNRALDYRN
jgi:hypothetical protein